MVDTLPVAEARLSIAVPAPTAGVLAQTATEMTLTATAPALTATEMTLTATAPALTATRPAFTAAGLRLLATAFMPNNGAFPFPVASGSGIAARVIR